jgi:hypothetical protein
VGTDLDTPNTVPVGGRVVLGVRMHRLYSFEAKAAYMVGRRLDADAPNDLMLWSIMARGLIHPTKTGGAKNFYFVAGFGIVSADGDVSPGIELGGGYALPLWDRVGLVVEIVYVMDVTAPRFDAVISSLGFRWSF